ncbi:hypothetical protein ACU5EH_04295 [Aliivibrio salmonicida]|uniref:hypothetical protein n=1 Tax=Aliivibrio salmonicida TaxID=40269 RepID=UPI00406D46B0
MKSIRFFHRRYNFTSNQKDRSRCERSLMHSLRIATDAKPTKQFEWNEDLSDSNLVWLNGETLQLNSLSDEHKKRLVFTTAPAPLIRDHTKLQTRQRQYRKKIKTAITAEYKNGNGTAAKFLEEILESSGHVSYSKIEKFKTMVMSRKNQRVKMLEIYLDAHNQTQSRPNLNRTFIQEGIFKIPHQWKISNKQVSLQEYMTFTVNFLTHHFPDYPIQLVFGHDDERDMDENTGAHTHYFLSGRNKITGEFDLLKCQKVVVNQYLEKRGLDDKVLPVDDYLSKEQTRFFGEMFQKMVFEYANEHLFSKKGLIAELAPESERRSKQRQKMNQEAKLPKSEREFNFHNLIIKKKKEQLLELKHQVTDAESRLDEKNTQLNIMLGELLMLKEEQLNIQQENYALSDQVQVLRAEKQTLLIMLRTLNDELMNKLIMFCTKFFMALHTKDLGYQHKAMRFLDDAMSTLWELPDPLKIKAEELISKLSSSRKEDNFRKER